MHRPDRKVVAVVCIELTIAILFIIGPPVADPALEMLYHCYFADVTIPFGFYFLLTMRAEHIPILRPWWTKAAAVFLLCATSETLQFFGIFALASVFDPVDYVMYGGGVILAAFFDRAIFPRVFRFWNSSTVRS
jgi:hypothetical protein